MLDSDSIVGKKCIERGQKNAHTPPPQLDEMLHIALESTVLETYLYGLQRNEPDTSVLAYGRSSRV